MIPDHRDVIANLDGLDPDPLDDRTLNGSTMPGMMPMTYAPIGTMMMYLVDVDRSHADSSWPQSLLQPPPSLLLPPLNLQSAQPFLHPMPTSMMLAVTLISLSSLLLPLPNLWTTRMPLYSI